MNSESLLAGPRGRELCIRLASPAVTASWARAESYDDTGVAAAELAAAVGEVDAAALEAADETALLQPLAESVCSAMYWQAPFVRERLLTDPQVLDVLEPIAAAVLRSPGSRWWFEPMPRDRQYAVRWGSEPIERPFAPDLDAWRLSLASPETPAATATATDPNAGGSGLWWSFPHTLGTARSLASTPAVGLFLVEECQGDFPSAVVHRVEVDSAARICEIASPQDWVRLTREYPLEVTHCRRYDWHRATGRAGTWLIPDWRAVGADWDGVHLSVGAYLAGATRALPVDNAATMIAGWGPDETYWLTDRARPVDDGTPMVLPEEWKSVLDWRRG